MSIKILSTFKGHFSGRIFMNSHVRRYYRKFSDEETPIRLFHEVIALHELSDIAWKEAIEQAPALPKGWFELSRLGVSDRVEFTKEFWLNTLPYIPHVHRFLQKFFSRLDDVGVYLTQEKFDSPFVCQIVYSLRDGSCFYLGFPPCSESQILDLRREFDEQLPEDYLAFLQIHNGFSKHTDTGLIQSEKILETYNQLRTILLQQNVSTPQNKEIDPKDLIPFYESFGQKSYQCFFAGWHPDDEMGNVYYSYQEKTISDYSNPNTWTENLAFATFLDWLIFYLEEIEV